MTEEPTAEPAALTDEQWVASLPPTFDQEYLAEMTMRDKLRLEQCRDLLSEEQGSAFDADRAALANMFNYKAGLSPALKDLSKTVSRMTAAATGAAEASRNRPSTSSLVENLTTSLDSAKKAERQRQVDMLDAMRSVVDALAEQNRGARHDRAVGYATLTFALISVIGMVTGTTWAISEDTSSTLWATVVAVLGGAVIGGTFVAIGRRKSD